MRSVGIFQAKTQLSALVAEVEKGGEVVITRAGRPVARLVAAVAVDAAEVARRRQLVDDLVGAARKQRRDDAPPLGAAGVKALVERGGPD